MADYIRSLLADYRSKIKNKFEVDSPILYSALKAANSVFDESKGESIRESTERMSTDRSNFINWKTFAVTLELWKQKGSVSIFTSKEMFNNQLSQMQRVLREKIAEYIIENLRYNRTQVSRAVLNGASPESILGSGVAWDSVEYAYRVSSEYSNHFFQIAANVMKQSNYYGSLRAITDPETYEKAKFMMNQGPDTAVNYSFIFSDYPADGIMMHPLIKKGKTILMPCGGIEPYCIIPWIPEIYRKGEGDMDSYNGGYDTIIDDKGYDMTYAVRGWSQKVDCDSNGSLLLDSVNCLELSVDIGFITAPLLDPYETAIIEFIQE